MRDSGLEFMLFVAATFILVLSVVGSRHSGITAENERLYNKCLERNSQMTYNKAVETCKEEVK